MSREVAQEKRTLQHRNSPKSSVLKPLRYGLPCANCKVYYSAELNVCPICSCAERVSPSAGLGRAAMAF